MRLPSFVFALLVAVSAPLAAQDIAAGRATFQLSVKLPDSLKSPIPIAGNLNMQIDFMSDGKRIAVELVPDASVAGAAGMRIKILFKLGDDTAHVAIIFSPEAAAAAGGMAGMRMDLPTAMMGPDNPLYAGLIDSISKTMIDSLGRALPVYRNLETISVVAGVRCEEWESVIGSDTTRTCAILAPRAIVALQERFKAMSGVGPVLAQIPGMTALEKTAYGGRKMLPIRMVNQKSGMRIELTGVTQGAPNADVFALPANLQVLPVPGKPAIDH